MFDISDLTGLSKPLTRLIEVISKGVGAVSESYLIRKNADAKAYEIKKIADALNEATKTLGQSIKYKNNQLVIDQHKEENFFYLTQHEHIDPIKARETFISEKKQKNIELITSMTAEELINVTNVADSTPDEDWITRFFTCAEDISNSKMQELWSRILTNEIKKPGSYSLKTLECIRNLSADDAQTFEKLGKYAVLSGGTSFIPVNDKKWLQKEYGIEPIDHFNLSELGCLYPTDLSIEIDWSQEIPETSFTIDGKILVIKKNECTQKVSLPIWKFTSVGSELLQLLEQSSETKTLEHIGKFYIANKCSAFIGNIVNQAANGEISYQKIRDL
jgi:hypothetical protein